MPGFRMVHCQSSDPTKTRPFEIQSLKSSDFKCFGISKGGISNPHCIVFYHLWVSISFAIFNILGVFVCVPLTPFSCSFSTNFFLFLTTALLARRQVQVCASSSFEPSFETLAARCRKFALATALHQRRTTFRRI